MTRVVPRTNFNGSKLMLCLAELDLVEPTGPDQAFAEKLGHWIHFTDAISLSAVHQEAPAAVPAVTAPPALLGAIQAEFERIRVMLENSIARSCSPKPGKSYLKLPQAPLELPLDVAAACVPYCRFYEAQQRDMELNIQPLRVNLRAALARSRPDLKKLAELDRIFDKILRERESKSLSRLPLLLKTRFSQLFKEHQEQVASSGQADDPRRWTLPGAWLARFCNELQTLLLAELELRLLPARGLLDAIAQDSSNETL
jgi:hypothetical protein